MSGVGKKLPVQVRLDVFDQVSKAALWDVFVELAELHAGFHPDGFTTIDQAIADALLPTLRRRKDRIPRGLPTPRSDSEDAS
jgi:hypothetical protein